MSETLQGKELAKVCVSSWKHYRDSGLAKEHNLNKSIITNIIDENYDNIYKNLFFVYTCEQLICKLLKHK